MFLVQALVFSFSFSFVLAWLGSLPEIIYSFFEAIAFNGFSPFIEAAVLCYSIVVFEYLHQSIFVVSSCCSLWFTGVGCVDPCEKEFGYVEPLDGRFRITCVKLI